MPYLIIKVFRVHFGGVPRLGGAETLCLIKVLKVWRSPFLGGGGEGFNQRPKAVIILIKGCMINQSASSDLDHNLDTFTWLSKIFFSWMTKYIFIYVGIPGRRWLYITINQYMQLFFFKKKCFWKPIYTAAAYVVGEKVRIRWYVRCLNFGDRCYVRGMWIYVRLKTPAVDTSCPAPSNGMTDPRPT